jgi:hypothetical protein
VTYDEAQRWLARIGGRSIEAKEQTRGKGSIIVVVESVRRGTVQRHWLFDDNLTGFERERAMRTAFTRACEELMAALA